MESSTGFLPVSCKMDALCCRRSLNSDNKKAIFLLLDIRKDSVVELRKDVSISTVARSLSSK
jgi:hypothetical protein